jgi:hypothetical protein
MDDDNFMDSPEALMGGPSSDSHSETSGLLLELTCAVAKLHILLSETDEDEWRGLRGRLGTFNNVVANLPKVPKTRRRLGFSLQATKPRSVPSRRGVRIRRKR